MDTVSEPTGQALSHSYVKDNASGDLSGQTAWIGSDYWYYSFTAPNASDMLGSVTDPNAVVQEVVTYSVTGQPVSNTLDPGGINLSTSNNYDAGPGSLLVGSASANGDTVNLTYSSDDRGNVTQRTQTGTGKPLTASYTYAANCTYIKTCNKPASVTDANGNVTDYTYDNAHGGVLTVQGAAVNGVRSLTTTSYSSFTAWYYTGPGTISPGGTVYLPTGTATCTNANSCSGNAAERVTALTYQTGSSSSGSNLLNLTSTVKAGDNSISATRQAPMISMAMSLRSPIRAAIPLSFSTTCANRSGLCSRPPVVA